jgi:hypothetical protein
MRPFLATSILLTCAQASGVLAAAMLFFTRIRHKFLALGSLLRWPHITLRWPHKSFALEPGACDWVVRVGLLLLVLQVCLGSLLRGAEAAEVEAAG